MRERLETAFGRWGQFVACHAGWVILAVLFGTALFATQLQHFRLETTLDGYFHPEDPVRLQNEQFREVFGRDAFVVVSLTPSSGLFDADFLNELRAVHDEIEDEVPYLVEVTSLINARETLGVGDTLQVGELFEEWPESEEALRAIEARARANPLYQNNLLSTDGRTTAIVIETEAYAPSEDFDALAGFDGSDAPSAPRKAITGEQDAEIVAALQAIATRHESAELEIHTAGVSVFNSVLATRMGSDMARFTALSIGLVALFLAILFRRVAAVVLPLVTVSLSVIATLSLMAATDTPLMPPTQMIPSFLLAVGVGGAVHLLAIFYQAERRGEDKPDAIAYALSHSGVPIAMTSITTAAGLLSFVPAALLPISHLGAITPVGVLLSLFYTLTLLPALIAVFPMRPAPTPVEGTASQQALVAAGAAAIRRAPLVLATWAALVAVSLLGMSRIHLGHDMLEWFPNGAPMHTAMHFMNDEFGGAVSYELLVSTGVENGLHEPAQLEKLEEVQRFLERFEHLSIRGSKVISIVDVVKETHRALNENQAAFYRIPDGRALVSQELLLFENSGSDDVEDLVTSDFETARLSVRVPFVDGAFVVPYIEQVLPEVRRILGPDVSVEFTGMFPLLGNTVTAALDTMIRSYTTALVVITLLMLALIGNIRLGLLSMLPNLAPVLLTLGLMGWLDVHLDMFTLMIGTIVMGLAVDDTIHFMHSFRRERERTGKVDEAVARTLRETGQALLFTSCVLASGFLVYTQAYMAHLFNFGLLTAAAIVVAFLADLTLAPALVATAIRTAAPEPD